MTAHEEWCHWGKGCCGCKCGAVEFGTLDPSTAGRPSWEFDDDASEM